MNYMEQVAHLLGVELEEEFKLNDSDDYKYKINKDGMFMYSGFASDWFSANHILLGVLIGKYEIEKTILDDIEKEYLNSVIKPFRDRVNYIKKKSWNHCGCNREYLLMSIKLDDDNNEYKSLPSFKNCTIYKGMEVDKEYTLEELGL